MALPNAETDVVELVKEEEAKANREKAVAEAAANQTKPAQEELDAADKPVAKAASRNEGTMDFLQSVGISDLALDFTSFPMVVLDKGHFQTADETLGDSFEFVYIDKRRMHLFKGDYGRDKDPELVYSDDGQVSAVTGEPIASYVKRWEEEGAHVDHSMYTIVICKMVSEPYESQLVQLQIPPRSAPALDGYLYGLGYSKVDPHVCVTKATIGKERGTGQKAFTPWNFSKVDV